MFFTLGIYFVAFGYLLQSFARGRSPYLSRKPWLVTAFVGAVFQTLGGASVVYSLVTFLSRYLP